MSLPNLFSRRKRRAEFAGRADVYSYDTLPPKLRVQITHVWDEAIGWGKSYHEIANSLLSNALSTIRKEKGVYQLVDYVHDDRQELYDWFLNEKNVDLCLDAVEMSCRIIDKVVRERSYEFSGYASSNPDEAIDEINGRFQEASIGYQYAGGQIVRVDSQLVHGEVVKPLLAQLEDPEFKSARKEFLEAHRLYRQGDFEQTLTECCKAFESTLKVIASRKGWSINAHATAQPLVDAAFDNGLVPEYLRSEFTALRSLLESGIPTVRNRSSGHGAGTTVRSIPRHLAAFQMHQTAAAILFLIDAANSAR